MVLKISIFFCLLASFLNVKGQKVDSLKALLKSNSYSKDNRFDILYGLAYELFDVDNNEAALYAKRAHALAQELGDSLKIVKAGRINGQLLRRVGRLNESVSVLSEVLPVASRNNFLEEKLKILNALAIDFTFLANYDKALECHFQSLTIREKEGDKAKISVALSNIGLVYYNLKNYKEAISYFLKTLQLKKQVNDNSELDRILINTGLCYNQLGDFIEAKKCFDNAFEACGKTCSNDIIVEANYGLGVLNFEKRNYKEALKYFRESYKISMESRNTRFQTENLICIARINAANGNYQLAIKNLEEAEVLAYSSGYNEITIDVFDAFLSLYNKSKQFNKVAFYQQKYIQLKDSIYSKELTANLMKMESAYHIRESQARIASQRQLLLFKEGSIQMQKKFNVAISLVAFCLVVIAVTLFKSNSQRKAINQLLESKVKERTKELEENRNELLKAGYERALLIEKTAQDIRSSLATIKGICTVGQKDISDPNALEYIRQVERTSEGLSDTLLVLQHSIKSQLT